MAKKLWQIELEDSKYEIELEHGYFSGKRKISVDGKVVFNSANLLDLLSDTGGVHKFDINSHSCAVIIRTNGFTFNYDLAVDGKSITTGQPLDSIMPVPRWVWWLITIISFIFCCLCAFISLLLITTL